jgi:biopolymer transport protein ExbD
MMLDSKKPIVSINLTPLVDVSLVLVVIFMATAPMFLQGGFAVTAGERKIDTDQVSSSQEENILLKLKGNTIELDQHPVPEAQLAETLKRLLAHSRSGRVIVNPEREVLHGRVVRVMDIAKRAGARKIVILGKANEGSHL